MPARSDPSSRPILVRPVRFERTTHGFEGHCSIQLSYGRKDAPAPTTGRIEIPAHAHPRRLLVQPKGDGTVSRHTQNHETRSKESTLRTKKCELRTRGPPKCATRSSPPPNRVSGPFSIRRGSRQRRATSRSSKPARHVRTPRATAPRDCVLGPVLPRVRWQPCERGRGSRPRRPCVRATRASSGVNSCARPWAWAALPPLLAISRCFPVSMDAKPRLLLDRPYSLCVVIIFLLGMRDCFVNMKKSCLRTSRPPRRPGAREGRSTPVPRVFRGAFESCHRRKCR